MTTIDNNPPMPVQNVEYKINDENNLTIEWNEPEDAVSYIIESRDNFSRPWEILENIDNTKNKMVYDFSESQWRISLLQDYFCRSNGVSEC